MKTTTVALVVLALVPLLVPGCSCLSKAHLVESVAGLWRLEYPSAGGSTRAEPLLFLQVDDHVEGCTPGLDLTGTLADDSLALTGSGVTATDTSALTGTLAALAPDRLEGPIKANLGGRTVSDDVTMVRWAVASGRLTLRGHPGEQPDDFSAALAAAYGPTPTSVVVLGIGPDATTLRLAIDFPDAPETGAFALVANAPTDDHARVRLVSSRGDDPCLGGTLTVTVATDDRFEGSLTAKGLNATFAVPMLGK